MPVPTVQAPTSADITSTTANLGGTVTLDGGLPVTERGVVFALTAVTADPRVAGAWVRNAAASAPGLGVFTVDLVGLQPNQQYSFAAYARNVDGPGFSEVRTFTTASAPADAPAPAGSSDLWSMITFFVALAVLAGVAAAATVFLVINWISPFSFLVTLATACALAVVVSLLAKSWSAPSAAAAPGANAPPVLMQLMQEIYSWEIAKTFATLPMIVFILVVSMILLVGYFVANNPASNDPTNFARTLITLLFATGTIAIAFILVVTAIMVTWDDKAKERLESARQVLTVMIGIFGTILGFYFGTATTVKDADVKISLVAEKTQITLTKDKNSEDIKVNLKLDGGKLTGAVQLGVTQHKGFDIKFNPDSIKADGVAVLSVTAEKVEQDSTVVLTIFGTLEGGAAVTPVHVKVNVKK